MGTKIVGPSSVGSRVNELVIGDDGSLMLAVSTQIYTGQKTAAVTGEALSTSQPCREVLVQADPTNVVDVIIGNATNQFVHLVPGSYITIPIADVSLVYVRVVSGTAIVNWLARS